jgi:hypothetical protein
MPQGRRNGNLLMLSDLHELRSKADRACREGRNLLEEMESQVNHPIELAKDRLESILQTRLRL